MISTRGIGPGGGLATYGLGARTIGQIVTDFIAGKMTFTQASRSITHILAARALTLVSSSRSLSTVASTPSMAYTAKMRTITTVSATRSMTFYGC